MGGSTQTTVHFTMMSSKLAIKMLAIGMLLCGTTAFKAVDTVVPETTVDFDEYSPLEKDSGSLLETGSGEMSLLETGSGEMSLLETRSSDFDGYGSLLETGSGEMSLLETGSGEMSLLETGSGEMSLLETGSGEMSLL